VFFIAGLTTRVKAVDVGSFQCPHEQAARRYQHLRQRRWLTLFFVPVLPIGQAREWVQCEGCGGAYEPGLLAGNPAAPLQG